MVRQVEKSKAWPPSLKLCGVRRVEDVRLAAERGFRWVGFNTYRGSKRHIDAAAAAAVWREAGVSGAAAVLVVVDAEPKDVAAALAVFPETWAVQCHGAETPAALDAMRAVLGGRELWKALPILAESDVRELPRRFAPHCDLVLLDQGKPPQGAAVAGGSGVRFDWRWLAAYDAATPLGVAGGVRPENVAELRAHAPALIDLSSGVERAPGVKDPGLVAAFFAALVAVFCLALPARAQDALENAKDEITSLPNPELDEFVSKAEIHEWDRYVRGFRRDHNFALSAGVSQGIWNVKRLGTLEKRKFRNSGVYSRFQYSFHLPLWRGFGYMLGSSFGYHYESSDRRRPFAPVPAYIFPGILTGLVVNISPVFRAAATFEANMERHDGVREQDGKEPDPEISITLEAFDFGAYFDVFYDLAWAIRVEAHHRHLDYLEPRCTRDNCRNKGFDVNANFKKEDDWLGIGLVHHLL